MSLDRACALADVPAYPGVLGVEVNDEPVALCYDVDGELHAVNNICSHQYVEMSQEGEVSGCEIECWLHAATFDLRTGAATGLPATRPIAVYPVEVRDGDVFVDVTAPRGADRPAPTA